MLVEQGWKISGFETLIYVCLFVCCILLQRSMWMGKHENNTSNYQTLFLSV